MQPVSPARGPGEQSGGAAVVAMAVPWFFHSSVSRAEGLRSGQLSWGSVLV